MVGIRDNQCDASAQAKVRWLCAIVSMRRRILGEVEGWEKCLTVESEDREEECEAF
jgi:hypothetical protein